jgi:peptidyl-prolyl cis-trans isomerase C
LFLSVLWIGQYLPFRAHASFVVDAMKKVQKDYQSLTRRVTARHILLPNDDVALALKRKIRTNCINHNTYIVTVFEEAAKRYSMDRTTNTAGGLLGVLVPQGYCRSEELDRACFEVTLGIMEGPIRTQYGYHLILVTERTNCWKLDGDRTQLVQTNDDDIFGTLTVGKQVGKLDPTTIVLDQIGFWFITVIAGGLMAELAERLVTSL